MQAFPATFPAARGAQTTGNPVRSAIAALATPAQRYAGRNAPLRLLVIGGSLGAAALNETLPQALALLPAAQRPQVRHQSGKRHSETLQGLYRHAGVAAELLPFIDDMAAAYAWADLVLCRAGALTVSELAAAGVPAVLVPYPYAVDDHQTRNAAYLTEAGAALLLPQPQMTPQRLAEVLQGFMDDAAGGRVRLLQMAAAARAQARPEATAMVAQACLAATQPRNAA